MCGGGYPKFQVSASRLNSYYTLGISGKKIIEGSVRLRQVKIKSRRCRKATINWQTFIRTSSDSSELEIPELKSI